MKEIFCLNYTVFKNDGVGFYLGAENIEAETPEQAEKILIENVKFPKMQTLIITSIKNEGHRCLSNIVYHDHDIVEGCDIFVCQMCGKVFKQKIITTIQYEEVKNK